SCGRRIGRELTAQSHRATLACLPKTMSKRSGALLGAVVAVCVSAACSSSAGRRPVQITPSAQPAAQAPSTTAAPAPVDPVQELLAAADRHFEAGRSELTLGHLARAKAR